MRHRFHPQLRPSPVWLVTLACAGTLMGVAPADAAAAKKADLAVTSVEGVPATTSTFDTSPLKVEVANRGKRRSRAATIFARVGATGGGTLPERIGSAQVGPIAPRQAKKLTLNARLPYWAIGQWRLVICAPPGSQRNDCLETNAFESTDGSSQAKIDGGLASGDLTAGEALLYEMYALTGDPALPAAYGGGGIAAGTALADLATAFPDLPAPDQAAVAPYLVPPRYEESAWNAPDVARAPLRAGEAQAASDPCTDLNTLEGAWNGVETAHAWFWYRAGHSAAHDHAQAMATEFEGQIWPRLTGAFKAVDDAALSPCDPAGDSKIDFYLSPQGNTVLGTNTGVAPGVPIGDACGPWPAFVIVRENPRRWVIAHEFMHVIQWAYKACDREEAWVEGTATWAGDFVYKNPDQDEHGWKDSLTIPGMSMVGIFAVDGQARRSPSYGYHSWPFWYALAKHDGSTGIKRLLVALADHDFAGAVEIASSDGLREAWKRYAVLRWNQTPIGEPGFPEESFKDWDSFPSKPGMVPTQEVSLRGAPEATTDLETFFDQRPLSTEFQRVDITDGSVRYLELKNADDGIQGTVVQVFLKLADGSWRLEDISDKGSLKLCRDKPTENVVEMIVATSNARATGLPLGQVTHKLKARDECNLYDITSVNGGFSWSVQEQFKDVPCTERRTVDWTTKLAPNNPPARLSVFFDQNGENPIYGFSTPPPQVNLTATGNGVATQQCTGPGNESCDLHVSRSQGLTIGGAQDSPGPSLKLDWIFAYPLLTYGTAANGGTCSSGLPGPGLLFHDISGGLFVSPINNGTSPAEPKGESTVQLSQFDQDELTLTLSGSDTRTFNDDQSQGTSSWEWSMTATFARH